MSFEKLRADYRRNLRKEANEEQLKQRWRDAKITDFTVDDYNNLLKSRKCYESIKYEYILIFQHDAWIINTIPISTFINLNKSYIGGNMSYRWFELERENIFPI